MSRDKIQRVPWPCPGLAKKTRQPLLPAVLQYSARIYCSSDRLDTAEGNLDILARTDCFLQAAIFASGSKLESPVLPNFRETLPPVIKMYISINLSQIVLRAYASVAWFAWVSLLWKIREREVSSWVSKRILFPRRGDHLLFLSPRSILHAGLALSVWIL